MSTTSQATRGKIKQKVGEAFATLHVEVIDESWKHAGHAGAAAGGGHFILHVVSERFEGVPLMDRHRMVFQILENEMQGEIHALVIKALTPREWQSC